MIGIEQNNKVKEKTMKKLTKIAIALFGATTLGFAGFGAYTFADNFWQGHNNIVQINNDLDQLSQTIKNKNDQLTKAKSDLAEAQKQLKDVQSSQSTLQDQLKSVQEQLKEAKNIQISDRDTFNNQLQAKEQELQKAITDGNAKVQAKQQEVDKANQQISNLNNQITDLTNQLNQKNQGQDSQGLSQAVKEAQDTRDHADTVVNNSK